MFEDLFEKSVVYDDHLLQAACVVQAEYDLATWRELAIIRRSEAFKQTVAEVAKTYGVSRKALTARLKEILEEDG